MSDGRGTLDLIGEHLTLALHPLTDAVSGPESFKALMYRLGWNVTDLPPAYSSLGGLVVDAVDLLENLDETPSPEQILDLIKKVVAAFDGIGSIAVAPQGVDSVAFLAEIGERLVELLLVDYLAAELPTVYSLLVMLGVIELQSAPASDGRPTYIREQFKWGELAKIISDPLSIPKRVYGWGTPQLNDDRIIEHLSLLFAALRLPATVRDAPDEVIEGYMAEPSVLSVPASSLIVPFYYDRIGDKDLVAGFVLHGFPASGGKLPGIVIEPLFPSELPLTFHLAETIDLRLRAGTNATELFGITIRPDEVGIKYPLSPDTPPPSVGIGVGFDFHPKSPVIVFGAPDSTRLEFQGASVDLGANYVNNELEIVLGAELAGLALILAASESDGFLRKVIGDGQIKIEVPLGLQWSSRLGFAFKGSASFEVTLHPQRRLGPISIDELAIRLTVPSDPKPKALLTVGASLSGELGPVSFAVQEIGFRVQLTFEEGNVGPFGIELGFKPPNGLGIVIEAGPITGGGFISFDFENQRYAGILQLKLYSIGVTAIGLLDTRLPGGQSGFSFLIIIAVEFTPIQIGFGFTLNGVGGLAGINRTIVTEILREGLRQKALDNILFPPDPVKRATQLISDLRRVFPPAENRYVFGPMLKIGWATFLEASLGVILEVPSPVRIIILGQVDLFMPERHAPIIELHLDVLGIIDFGEKLFSLDASLYDSRVALFNISGDMALRLSWGDNPSFALSVGGFNPHFQPPPNFPVLRRLCISLGYEDNPRLALEAYFAVTSNSFQFGASLSLYAELGPLIVKGFMGFDALFIFQPFSFIIDFQAGLDLSLGPLHLIGIYISATLSGPTPYHIVGEARVSILFFEISAHIDFTFGDEKNESVPGTDPWPLLQAAVVDQRNWSASLPPASVAAVTLAAPEGSKAPLLIDPLGGATLRQKAVPLNQRLTKFGEAAPLNHDVFEIETIRVGTSTLGRSSTAIRLVSDHFAPGQFREMTDAEKISSPSFVDLTAGFTLASDAVTIGGGMEAKVEYTTRLVDTGNATSTDAGKYSVESETLLRLTRRGTLASELASAGLARFALSPNEPALVALADEQFVVAQKTDLKVRGDITQPVSKGLAQLALADYLNRKPSEREILQVVPLTDTKEAA